MNGSVRSGKEGSFCTSEGVLTYKRRKRRNSASGRSSPGESGGSPVEQEFLKTPHQTFPCNGNYEISGQARIVHHWRKVLEELLQLSTDTGDGCAVPCCIQKALSCGPLGLSNKLCKDAQSSDRQEKQAHKNAPDESMNSSQGYEEAIQNGLQNSMDNPNANVMCQNVLFDVFISQKFALLCDLLCQNFQSSKTTNISEFNLIISRMKDGVYGKSLELFVEDVQLVWDKFQKVGKEMASLASNLSSILRDTCKELDIVQVRECSGQAAGEQKQENAHVVINEKQSMDLCTKLQLASHNSHSPTRPVQTGAHHLNKVSTCIQCSAEAFEKNSLICDACEAVYHVLCIKPPLQKIPTRNWYCAPCLKNKGSAELDLTNEEKDCRHQNCKVCHRHEDSGCQENRRENPGTVLAAASSKECPIPSMESTKSPDPSSTTAVACLCKKCGTCEEEDKRFLVCSHSHCPYKYYHIRCLKSTQVASQHQKNNGWYCPSCLCRGCLTDRDDESICMCDCCDEAYHIYCMKPPQSTIPAGTWYCSTCEQGRKRSRGSSEEKI